MLWVDRTWAFDFPSELHPSLVERLRGTPARLEEAVRGLARDELTRHAGESWSIQENVGHLLDLEYLPRARLDDFLSSKETLTAADMTNRVTHHAEHDARDVAELLREFRTRREALVARLDGLAPEDFAKSALHPRLATPMRLVDMCLFHADHDDHHLARISELARRWRAEA